MDCFPFTPHLVSIKNFKLVKSISCLLQTRILVTHGISFLPQVDQIIVLKDGGISEVGSYNQLLEQNGAFSEFLQNYSMQEEEEEEGTEEGEGKDLISLR